MDYFPYRMPVTVEQAHLRVQTYATDLGPTAVYRPAGATGAPDTVLLHGVGLTSLSWAPLLAAARIEGVGTNWALLDVPGFGLSAPLTGPVTLNQVAAAAITASQAAGVPFPTRFVGHSMGGFLAMHIASAFPKYCQELVTIAGAYATVVDCVNHPVTSLLSAPATALTFTGLRTLAHLGPLAEPLLQFGARTRTMRPALTGVARHASRVPPDVLYALAAAAEPISFLHAMATGRNYDYRTRWATIAAPTTAIFGAHDTLVTRRDQRVLNEALPAARIKVIAETAHFVLLEDPHAVLAELARMP